MPADAVTEPLSTPSKPFAQARLYVKIIAGIFLDIARPMVHQPRPDKPAEPTKQPSISQCVE